MAFNQNSRSIIFISIVAVATFFALAETSQAATYYIDATNGNDSWTGTAGAYQSGSTGPWKTISKVNNFAFQTGDDVYFKCGETWDIVGGANPRLYVDWSGLESNEVIVGAYHLDQGTPVHSLSGNKPHFKSDYVYSPSGSNACKTVIDDANGDGIDDNPNDWDNTAGACYFGLVHVYNRTRITIQDISVSEVRGIGIYVEQSPNVTVQRCDVSHTYTDAIAFNGADSTYGKTGCSNGKILYNTVQKYVGCFDEDVNNDGLSDHCSWPAAIGAHHRSNNTLIKGNVIKNGLHGESIGCYFNSDGIIIEDNIIYSHPLIGIYLSGNITNSIVRRNLIYGTTDTNYQGWVEWDGSWRQWPGGGIAVEDEAALASIYACAEKPNPWGEPDKACHSKGIKIYDNLIAYAKHAFWLSSPDQYGWVLEDVDVFNNTIVAASVGFNVPDGNRTGAFIDIDVRNNLVSCAGETYHCDNFYGTAALQGFKFANNIWPKAATAPYSGSGDITASVAFLAKTSGWRNLSAGSLSSNDFKLQSTSPAIERGAALGSPYNTDFFGTTRPQGAGWDIGAHEFTASSGDTTAPSAPVGLSVR